VPWLFALAAVASAACVSWEESPVSQDELSLAVGQVAERLDGAGYVLPERELRRQLGAELGHPVDLVSTANPGPDTAERQQNLYDVTPRADPDGPAMCRTVVVTSDDAGPRTSTATDAARC